MILAQSPVFVPMSPPSTHRRHPSAPPAVVVQPTKVPGILSISKPSRPARPQHHPLSHPRQHRSPKPKSPAGKTQLPQQGPRPATDSSAKSTPVKQPSSEAAAVPTVDRTTTAHPSTPAADKSARGRQTKSPKDKASTRSASDTHGRRNNVRQPSPPLPPSSQAEGTNLIPPQSFARHTKNFASNSFDPFLTSSDSDSDHSRTFNMSSPAKVTPPKLSAQPSGKLARRRNPPTPTPTPAAKAVPVPRSNTPHNRHSLSRSAPSHSSAPLRQTRLASAGAVAEFPVCDDTTDAEDNSLPTTPTRESTWQLGFDGPRTAPLATPQRYPFGGLTGALPPSPTRHRRAPSEGVFNMSFDEEMSLWDTSEELKQMSGSRQFASVGHSFVRAGQDKSGFFASSVFQNAPSPDELPPPAF
ncbi:hypothetical protein BKA82DRAFT_4138400 [Pisolithus tinctorius]|nr:hypothetical protein BKA82DRAFT_4138400 [Pisolithus tinctorius]